MMDLAINLAERAPLPDAIIRAGMRRFIAGIEEQPATPDREFARQMASHAIAEQTGAANAQHYELPPDFFVRFLGPQRKYSCCLYPKACESLAEAEELALAETAAHAGLCDGQDILELGCGWGSLSLWMARHYPRARITAVSNSAPQRLYIQDQARALGLPNLTVITADMNSFALQSQFDRVVSVEMFEHMANWQPLLARIRLWLRPQGRLFLHIFAHRNRASRYEAGGGNWMAQHFFTGGIMPTPGLIRQFPDLFSVEQEWRWSGAHYQRTAEQWLENFDTNQAAIAPVLRQVYGADAAIWRRRWRMFLLATAESFGWDAGQVWGIHHYRLSPA
jgi:cyclopropane-fatty-acyl-phospholipid synthase